ncbi:hypothetical protein LCGC14_2825930, partial [marine sediment metagenome]
MAIGDITAKDRLVRTNVGTSGRWCLANNNYWILAYNKDASNSITVETYHVHPKGVIGTIVDTQDFSELYGSPSFAKQISTGVVAIWGLNGSTIGGDGKIITIAVSSTGAITSSILGSLVYKVVDNSLESLSGERDAVNTSGTYWAFPFQWGVFNGSWTYTWRLAVVSISLDGATLSVTDDDQISTYSVGSRCNIKAASGTIFAVGVEAGKVITVDINSSGVITDAGVDSNDFSASEYQWIEKLSNDWWVMVYRSGISEKASSFQISEAGVIDNSFTATTQFGPSSPDDATIFDLGGNTTSYLIINCKDAVQDAWVATCSCDIAGAMTTLQTLEWETVNLVALSMRKVAYNMFLVEGHTGGQDIY